MVLRYKQLDFNPNYYISSRGFVVSVKKKGFSILNPRIGAHGYFRVYLRDLGLNKRKDYYIHRLVALYFLDNPNDYNEVNHIDGNKGNNHVENLEWCNRSQNNLHAYENDLHKPCYKPCVINGIAYKSQTEAAEKLGVARSTIQNWLKCQ
jgi:hypothetical protein